MIPLSAAQISEILSSPAISGDPDKIAESVTIDSRTAGAGDCFFAIVGERLDGHDFVDQALAAGAGIIVVQRPIQTTERRTWGAKASSGASNTVGSDSDTSGETWSTS